MAPCRPWTGQATAAHANVEGDGMTVSIDKWTARTRVIECEFSDEELETLRERATAQGLTLEEYLRVAMGMAP